MKTDRAKDQRREQRHHRIANAEPGDSGASFSWHGPAISTRPQFKSITSNQVKGLWQVGFFSCRSSDKSPRSGRWHKARGERSEPRERMPSKKIEPAERSTAGSWLNWNWWTSYPPLRGLNGSGNHSPGVRFAHPGLYASDRSAVSLVLFLLPAYPVLSVFENDSTFGQFVANLIGARKVAPVPRILPFIN